MCGARVSGDEPACPGCGATFTKETKFECPFCAALVPHDSETCPHCGISLKLPEEKPIETTLNELLEQVIREETQEERAKGKRFSCPNCSYLLVGTEDKCPKCSYEFTKVNQVHCPICASLIPSTSNKCPICDRALVGLDELASLVNNEPKAPVVEGTVDDVLIPELEGPDKLPEPKKEPEVEPPPPVGASTPAMALCPRCGKASAVDAPSCPFCKTVFEPFAQPEKATPIKDNGHVVDQAALALDSLLIESKKGSSSKSRKLKPNREATTTVQQQSGRQSGGRLGKVNGTGLVNGRRLGHGAGVTNGTGLVNGAGATNGLGAVNGISMINGKGASNGLGVKTGPERLSKRDLIIRWRLLVVLVALMIVVPTFLLMSSLRPDEDYLIDGDFDEWASVQSYPVQTASSSAGINVQEWSAVFVGDDLYYYIRTQSDAMAGSSVENFCMFIDTDSSSSTGYSLGAMGAEYRIIIEGWNGTIYSASVSQYESSGDLLDWNRWASEGSSEAMLSGDQIEGYAHLGNVGDSNPRVILISKDESENLCFSVPMPIGGSLLIVEQAPVQNIAATGIIGSGTDIPFLRLVLTALGGSGTVQAVNPETEGCDIASAFPPTDVSPGTNVTFSFRVDTSSSGSAQFIAASVSEEDIESDFDCVLLLGAGAKAYLTEPPENVTIDGAFAEWDGLISLDTDLIPVQSANADIQETGSSNSTQNAYFYLSVRGEICYGAYLPMVCAKPTSGGGGSYIPARRTAEDITRIYVDSDVSSTTGLGMSYLSKSIGADRMIEVRGLFGRILTSTLYEFVDGNWVETASVVEAQNDDRRMELAVSLADLGPGSAIDFIFETTSWNAKSDYALFDPSALGASAQSMDPYITRSWPVDSSVTPTTATAGSYQRKLFYDGTNFWSFYVDGSDTVYKYSSNGGVSWTSRGQVFAANNVQKVSIWYDSSNNIVYAIGDTSTASTNVKVKRGAVTPGTATISWGSDYDVPVSTLGMANKNSFICKANDGYLWLICQDYADDAPVKYQLGVWKSNSTDDVSGWTFSADILSAAGEPSGTAKGTIVPAGSNGYVWAIFAYGGNVKSKKYDGAWPGSNQDILTATGTLKQNTQTAPPSAVVDSRGVVHVVYGDCTESGGVAYTRVLYTRNNTDAETYATATDLDSTKPSNVADISPTISLESSTGDLYAFWIQTDTSMVGKTIMGKKYSSGSWTSLTLDGESSYTKQHLTSVYSASGASRICFQWTQNTSSPIEVMFDKIPEFGNALVPAGLLIVAVVLLARRRSKRRTLA